MFLCEQCTEGFWIPVSYGLCESCGKTASCANRHPSRMKTRNQRGFLDPMTGSVYSETPEGNNESDLIPLG